MNDPLISVIVPAFNVELYILKCIQSILSSTIKNIEVIAVDDCSTDRTLEILRGVKDSRLRVISNQLQKGVSAARNTGLHIASGKYISFVDADDWISPIMFERLVKAAEKTDSDIVFCNYYKIYGDKIIDTCDIVKDLYFEGKTGIDQYLHMFIIKGKDEYKPYFPMGQSFGTLYKRSLILMNKIEFVEGMQYKEDVIFNLYAAQCSKRIIRISDSLYYYNKNNVGSLTSSYPRREMIAMIEKDINERRLFLNKCRQEDDVFRAGYYHYVFTCFYRSIVSICADAFSYEKCREIFNSEIYRDAFCNLNDNALGLKERVIYHLLVHHGLPLLYYVKYVYVRIRKRKCGRIKSGVFNAN